MATKQNHLTIQIDSQAAYLTYFQQQRADVSVVALQVIPMIADFMPRSAQDVSLLIDALNQALSTSTSPAGSVTLVIPARWCFFQRVPMNTPRWTMEAAAYEFEKFVPAALEHLTWVVERIDPQFALVIAAHTEPLRSLIDAIEKRGGHVERIISDVQAACLAWDQPEERSVPLFVRSGSHAAAAIRSTDGSIANVCSARSPYDTLTPSWIEAWTRRLEQADAPVGRWFMVDLNIENEPLPDGRARSLTVEIRACGSDAIQQIAQAVVTVRRASNLRVGALVSSRRFAGVKHRTWQCLTALLVLCCVLACSDRWEAARCRAATEELEPLRAAFFERAFPGSTPDAAAALRVQSELVKLRGLTSTSGKEGVPTSVAGLHLVERLSRVIAQFPAETKVLLTEVAVEGDDLRLSGMSTAHDAAGDIVRALGELPDLEVDPPRSSLRKDGTVEFHIHARERRPPHDS